MLLIYLSLIDNLEDQEKITQLYEKYKDRMIYIANDILKNTHSAEDAVHEAFMRVMKNLHKISDVDCPQTRNYLFIIVKNVALSMKKNENFEIPMSDDESFMEEESDFNLEDECLSKINFEIIVSEIQKLPNIYKDVVYMECVMEMSISEIAGTLLITREAVKKRLQRGRRILIENLKKEALIYDK